MFLVELRVLHPCNSSNRQWGILTSIPLSVFYKFCHLWSTSSVQRVTSLNVCGIFLKSNCSDQCVILADLNSFCGFIFDYLSCNRENGSQWRSLCFGNLLTWKWWHDHLNCRFLYGIWYIYSWLPHVSLLFVRHFYSFKHEISDELVLSCRIRLPTSHR